MNSQISQYTLYRETESTSDPEFFHVETIRSRARAFNWHIGVHRHPKHFQVIFIASGHSTVMLDGESRQVQGPYLVSVPSSAVHGFEFEQDTTGYVVTVSNLVLEQDTLKQDLPYYDLFVGAVQSVSLDPNESHFTHISSQFDDLYSEYQEDLLGKRGVFLWGLFGILARMARLLPKVSKASVKSASELKFAEVKQLIEAQYRIPQSVDQLAHSIGLTSLALNRLCHKVAGKSFKELMNSRIVLEAQRMLIYSTAPVSSIAYEVGFTDPAYFSRFFTKWVGLSPTEFRTRRQQIG